MTDERKRLMEYTIHFNYYKHYNVFFLISIHHDLRNIQNVCQKWWKTISCLVKLSENIKKKTAPNKNLCNFIIIYENSEEIQILNEMVLWLFLTNLKLL